MAQINKPSEYFNTVLYTGNSATSTAGTLARTISGVGFQPDFTWVKSRTSGGYASHGLHDVVRTASEWLSSDQTSGETDVTDFNHGGIGSFTSDGFGIFSGLLGSTTNYNNSGTTYASWNWKANGAGVSNTDGSITSTVSASTTSGFSIVSYTGTGANATVGHGLGVAPKMIIVKNRDQADAWYVYHSSLGGTKYLSFNSTGGEATNSTLWQDTNPTSSFFYIGTNDVVNTNTENYIAYCFAEKKGFSKFGSYTGNGSADGPFIYTGFKPAMVIRKISSTDGGWLIQDSTRTPFNGLNSNTNALRPSSDEVEFDFYDIDYLSNGFKLRTTEANHNASGATFIYMAFAENPLVGTNNIPATAR